MLPVHVLARLLDDVIGRLSGLIEVPRGVAGRVPQPRFVTLVARADRIEAPDRVARVDHHRNLVLGAHLPEGVDTGVVGLDVGAIGVLGALSQGLRDLDANCAGLEPSFRQGRVPRGPSRLVDAVRTEREERGHATLEREARLQDRVELIARTATEVADGADAHRVKRPDHGLVLCGGRQRARVVVEIDQRILRPGDVGSRQAQQRRGHPRRFNRFCLPSGRRHQRFHRWQLGDPCRAFLHASGRAENGISRRGGASASTLAWRGVRVAASSASCAAPARGADRRILRRGGRRRLRRCRCLRRLGATRFTPDGHEATDDQQHEIGGRTTHDHILSTVRIINDGRHAPARPVTLVTPGRPCKCARTWRVHPSRSTRPGSGTPTRSSRETCTAPVSSSGAFP